MAGTSCSINVSDDDDDVLTLGTQLRIGFPALGEPAVRHRKK